jgi:hypothetical protein
MGRRANEPYSHIMSSLKSSSSPPSSNQRRTLLGTTVEHTRPHRGNAVCEQGATAAPLLASIHQGHQGHHHHQSVSQSPDVHFLHSPQDQGISRAPVRRWNSHTCTQLHSARSAASPRRAWKGATWWVRGFGRVAFHGCPAMPRPRRRARLEARQRSPRPPLEEGVGALAVLLSRSDVQRRQQP